MSRRSRKRHTRKRLVGKDFFPESVPGILTVDFESPRPAIRVLAYGPDAWIEEDVSSVGSLPEYLRKWPVTWIQVTGLGDAQILQEIGILFNLHRLALEDVVSNNQRGKFEPYEDHLFLVGHIPKDEEPFETEQLSIFIGKNYVLTFQERSGDGVGVIRERIREKRGRIRNMGADYLGYALLDSMIDHYLPILETLDTRLEELEDEIFERPTDEGRSKIHDLKRELRTLRKAVWPLPDVVEMLMKDDFPSLTKTTRVYLRDCHDHIVHITELIEIFEDQASDLMDLYLSSVSARMNDVMKVLTVIATIFIPLTFIAGIYGMNFNTEISSWNMPELDWYWGYPFALGLMVAVAGMLLLFFKRRRWL